MIKNPHPKACGAFKNGKLIKAWKTWPDAWDTVDVDFDSLRLLTDDEVIAWTGGNFL